MLDLNCQSQFPFYSNIEVEVCVFFLSTSQSDMQLWYALWELDLRCNKLLGKGHISDGTEPKQSTDIFIIRLFFIPPLLLINTHAGEHI